MRPAQNLQAELQAASIPAINLENQNAAGEADQVAEDQDQDQADPPNDPNQDPNQNNLLNQQAGPSGLQPTTSALGAALPFSDQSNSMMDFQNTSEAAASNTGTANTSRRKRSRQPNNSNDSTL